MKNLLKIMAFGAGLIILLSILSVIFNGGDLAARGSVIYYDRRIAEINNESEGQIDVLCLGDSLCAHGFNSPSLYRDYGITSYNMGKEMEKPVELYYCIKKALKTQPIKVVLWEPHHLIRDYDLKDPLGFGLAEALRYRFPFIKYHTFWKFFTDGRSIRKYFKGFLVTETVEEYSGEVPYYDLNNTDVCSIGWNKDFMIDKVQKLCEENGIRLILVSFVSPKCYNMPVHRRIEEEARERGLEYVDLNCELDKLNMDWANDYYDGGDHVNLFGSEKIASYLGEYLREECGMKDHRGDPGYRSWDEMLSKYEQEVQDMEGTDYFILEDDAGIQRQIRVLTKLDSDKYEEQE